jgi:small conductance mechanosensitive channel
MNLFNTLLETTSEVISSETSSSSNTSDVTDNAFFKWLSDAWLWLQQNGIKLIVGLVVLALAWFIVNVIMNLVRRRELKKNKHSPAAINAVCKTIGIVLKILLILAFLGFEGVETSGVAVMLSSLSVVIGLAVQGALSNVAGGVVILIMRPFKIDDFIEAQGYMGTVEIIHMFYTYIITPDNKKVAIPNGTLANGVIVNYTAEKTRRVDMKFSVSYDTDLDKAKTVLLNILKKHKLVLKNPEPVVKIFSYENSSIDFIVRPWVKASDYWTVYFDVQSEVKAAFDKEGISIPFNQLDVHLVDEDKKTTKKVRIPSSKNNKANKASK